MHKMGAEGAIMARLLAARGASVTVLPTACGGLYSCERACDGSGYRLAADGDDSECRRKVRRGFALVRSCQCQGVVCTTHAVRCGTTLLSACHAGHTSARRKAAGRQKMRQPSTTCVSTVYVGAQIMARRAEERRADTKREDAARHAWAAKWAQQDQEDDDGYGQDGEREPAVRQPWRPPGAKAGASGGAESGAMGTAVRRAGELARDSSDRGVAAAAMAVDLEWLDGAQLSGLGGDGP